MIGFLTMLVVIVLFVREIISLLIAILDKKAGYVPLHILGTISTALLTIYLIIIVFKIEFTSDIFCSIVLALSIVFFFALSIDTILVDKKRKRPSEAQRKSKSNNK